MKITNAEFIISAVQPHQYPIDALPEIALAGRSNVGKSSLINKLIMRKNLARTSSQPGKTQQLNYYKVNEAVYFVDFPGYGYAKVSKTEREAWGKMIERYLQGREELKLVLLVVDIRHAPSKDDVLMFDWLKHYDIPFCIVCTKADKIPKSQWDKQIKLVKQTLGASAGDQVVLFSSEKGNGRDELWSVIASAAGYEGEVLQGTPES
ncbi:MULTISPECIES: ribosome biogenesis GTP-binding protein YihA/YsxC [unclassified Paenibacillus]|uniref:ribosome biogenesis GTP-binding protein YihA/YsxC n=1 Tax=unclassified Paenibacillus TaxID=185978 RepID=UPI000953D06D|nr:MULTISPECIES: ribosome biogenesis GTP-binding protein YihA/YsxC [unclassified Paenibacillus]ASS66350.1 YihA family ribosome biogenesis GTP-binding protein [Paenibacillus sp. RUD330]SIQ07018.1 GTP-binding protein [Paenibacillus sp. RU4X]SIQ27093.1 GTP-binding protein [Paenibacillus sp. RU4T]